MAPTTSAAAAGLYAESAARPLELPYPRFLACLIGGAFTAAAVALILLTLAGASASPPSRHGQARARQLRHSASWAAFG